MPSCGTEEHFHKCKNWKCMPAWERKRFHRENESRVRRGLTKLAKPNV